MYYLLSLDIGTQGTKGAAYDENMNEVATSFVPSVLVSPKPGIVWQEPEDMLLSAAKAVKELTDVVDASKIAAIGLDGQMAGIMGVDASGMASTKYDSWLDTRCLGYAKKMLDIAGDAATRLSGGQITCVHAPKMLWLKNECPEAYNNTRKFVLPHTYIVMRMCDMNADKAYYDYTHLHFSCLADNKNKLWSKELASDFGLDAEKLARIASPFEIVGYTGSEFSLISGLKPGTPVAAGCGDTAASTFGAGLFKAQVALDCAGTASVLAGAQEDFSPDVENRTLTLMRCPVDGIYAPLSYIAGGGLCVRWLRDAVGSDYATLEREASMIPRGSEGLMFVPHFSGRVLPNDPALKGAFLGLDYRHTRAHMYRAVMESVAYEYAYYLNVLRSLYPNSPVTEIKVMGGGAKSALFNRIKSEVLGVEYQPFESSDTALIGSAVIAGVGAGLISDYAATIESTIKYTQSIKPDSDAKGEYEPYANRYLEAIKCVSTYGEKA